jgi:hypothetical protein
MQSTVEHNIKGSAYCIGAAAFVGAAAVTAYVIGKKVKLKKNEEEELNHGMT